MNYITAINSFWYSVTMNPLFYRADCFMVRFDAHKQWMQLDRVVPSAESGAFRTDGNEQVRNTESEKWKLKQRGLIDFRERGTKTTFVHHHYRNSKQVSVQDSKQKQ